jgi:hypothetical protein
MFRNTLDLLSASPTIRRPASFRPALEALEERTVPTATTTSLAVSSGSVGFGQPVTLTVTLTSGDFVDNGEGTVTILDNGTAVGTLKVKGVGVGSPESKGQITLVLPSGNHSLTASYSGGIIPGQVFPRREEAINDASSSSAVQVSVGFQTGDVTPVLPVSAERAKPDKRRLGQFLQNLRLRNLGTSGVLGPLTVLVKGMPKGAKLLGAGVIKGRLPGTFLVTLNPGGDNLFSVGEDATLALRFVNPRGGKVNLSFQVFAGPVVL